MSDKAYGPMIGVNLPWFFGAYGHDMSTNERLDGWGSDWDVFKAYRPLVESRDMGFHAVRIWLCENGEGIRTQNGKINGVNNRLTDAIAALQDGAKIAGLRVYWTLLDGNSWQREGDSLTHSIVTDGEQTERFNEHVVGPIVKLLRDQETFAFEIINEPEAMTAPCLPKGSDAVGVSWEQIASCVRSVGDFARKTAAFPMTVTTGTVPVWSPSLWRCDPKLDAMDVHIYHDSGGIPSREELAAQCSDARIASGVVPVIAGECGIPDNSAEDASISLQNFLYNGHTRGYDAMFLWRLERVLLDSKSKARPLTEAGRLIRDKLRELRATPPV